MPKKLTQDQFLEKANTKHNFKYDYSLSFYDYAYSILKIICPTHGIFEQKAYTHIHGRGCPECGGSKKLTHDEFVIRAISVHGNTYKYPFNDYKNTSTKIKILCHIHGVFHQTPNSHLNGSGCGQCGSIKAGEKNQLGRENFIKKSKLTHGDKYNYDLVDYKTSFDEVTIECIEHGYFNQIPNSHLSGYGCIECARMLTGWNRTNFVYRCNRKNVDGQLYLVRCSNINESFYKIGITSQKSINHRFRKSMPYAVELISIFKGDPAFVWNKEKDIHRELKNKRYHPLIDFHGMTECFSELTQEVKDFFGVQDA